jgi:hypothetical protein
MSFSNVWFDKHRNNWTSLIHKHRQVMVQKI